MKDNLIVCCGVVAILAVAVLFLYGVNQEHDRSRECKSRGGTYLTEDGVCVSRANVIDLKN